MTPFAYERMALEEVPCNGCGGKDWWTLATRSANGLPARTCLCRQCGSIYLNPRMTRDGYDAYYQWFYRNDREAIKREPGKENDLEANFRGARRYGQALARRLAAFLKSGLTLDVGSSTGGALAGLREEIPGLRTVGVEPSPAEAAFANARGVPTHVFLFENGTQYLEENYPPFENIACLRSLNHLLDPNGFIRWCYDRLRAGGHLVLEVKNFRHQARRANAVHAGVQIDHPHMFTPETLAALVRGAGFRVAYLENDEYKDRARALRDRAEGFSIHHIRLVGEKPAISGTKRERVVPAQSSGAARRVARRLRLELSRPAVHLYYALFYAGRLRPVRRFLPFLSRN